ncbi:MAG: hypothetical protein WCC11_09465, partial [Gammaproteobacteria bacterium]
MDRKSAGLLLCLAVCSTSALAGPQGGQVVAGQGNITSPNANTTLINQQSNRLVIDWTSFNLASNETVQFNQPSVSAAALNRILSQNPSQIFGSIIANGQVYLLNPNGIIFGKTAMVNVGGLFATGLNISNSDFMSGKLNFAAPAGQDGGYVINHGVLQAADGGSINLIGSSVFNDGIIIANLGQVNMAAGSAVTVDFNGDGLMQFQVNGAVLHKMVDAQSGAAVTNAGRIEANGGTVVMTAAVAEQVLMQAVNNSGIVQAGGVQNRNGHIYLTGNGGDVLNSGTLDASNANGNGGSITLQSTGTTEMQGNAIANVASINGQGGTVELLGNQVGLFDNASINADGAAGGGTILVGGDAHGSGNLQLAQATYIGSDASLSADATLSGNGGQVVVWGSAADNFYGSISARGGAYGGNGGWVETSAHTGLNVFGHVDAAAPYGAPGIWLLDPYNVTIQTGGAPFSNPFTATATSTIDPSLIDTALTGGTNVFVFTNTASNGTDTGNITVNSPIAASGAGSLYLEAVGSILLNANIASDGADPLNLYLWANYGGAAAGTTYSSNTVCPTCQVIVGNTANAAITTTGGLVDIRTGDAINAGGSVIIGGGGIGSINTGGGGLNIVANGVAFDGAVATGSGNLNILSSGAISQSQALSVGGTTTISAGANPITLNNVGNAFSGAVSLANSGANNVVLTNNLATLLAAGSIGGNLTVVSNGAITQTGALTVAGTSNFNAGANAITLNNAANDFVGAVTLINSGANAVSLNNGTNALTIGNGSSVGNNLTLTSGALSFGGTTVGGNLSATTTGAITQTGALTVTGASNFSTGAFAITLGNGLNNFTGAVTLTNSGANAVTLSNGSNSLTIGSGTSVGGNLTLSSEGVSFGGTTVGGNLSVLGSGAITQTGALTVAGTSNFSIGTFGLTLNNVGNNFTGAVSLTNSGANNVALTTSGVLTLGTLSLGSGTLALTGVGITEGAAGTITQAAGAGAVSINAGAGAITLSNANKFTGVVTLTNSGANAATLSNGASVLTLGSGTSIGGSLTLTSGALSFGGATVGGNLSAATTGAITQTGALTVAGTTSFNAPNFAITLNNAGNSFTGAVSLNNSGNFGVTLVNSGALALGASNVVALNITANGAITQTGALTVAGATILAAGAANNITLNNAANAFTGPVIVTSSNNVLLTNNIATVLGASTVSGTLGVISNGAITQTGALNVVGATTLAAGVANNITLNNVANAFTGTVAVTAGNNVLLTNSIATVLGASTVSGTLGVTSNGAITQTGALTVARTTTLAAGAANNITLNNAANAFTGAVGITTGNNVLLTNNIATVLGTSTVSGTLGLTSNGAITQNGNLTVKGATTLAAGVANNITLSSPVFINTFTGAVSVTSGNNVALANSRATVLGASTISGTLGVTSNGAITQTGALTVTGISNFTAGAFAITLNNAGNNFTGAVSLTNSGANLVALTNSTALTIGTVSVGSGTLGLSGVGINEGATGTITQAAGAGAVAIFAGAGIIALGNANDFTGAVTLKNSGANNVTLNNGANLLTLGGASSVGTGTLTLTSVGITEGAAGTITQAAGAGAVSINAGAGAIALGNANDFTGAVTLTNSGANAATLSNGANALTLGSGTSIGGNLTLTSGALSFGTTTVGGALAVTTTGAITQTGALTVAGTTTLAAGAANNITLNNAGNAFTGAVGITTGKNVLLTNNIATVLGASTVSGTLGVTSNGTITNTGNLSVSGASTFTVTAANSDILLNSAGNNFAGAITVTNNGNVRDLSLTNINAAAALPALPTLLRNLTINFQNAALTLPSTTLTGNLNVTTGGALTQSGALIIAGTTMLAAGAGNNITLNNASNNFTGLLSVTSADNVTLNDGGALNLGGLALNGNLNVTASGGITLNNNIATPGTQTYNSAVTLAAANTDLTGSTVTFNGTLNGNDNLTVTGNGVFNGLVGNLASLNSLLVTGGVTLNTTAVNTSGTQTYGGAVTLAAANTDLTGSTVTFNGTLNGNDNLTVTGNGIFNGVVGGSTRLASLAVTGATTLDTISISTIGSQTYGGAATLAANTNLTGSTVTFNGTLNGNDNLTVTGNGVFNGVVGGSTPLASLSVTGTAALNTTGLSTVGSQIYNSAVTLGGPVTLTGSAVDLVSTVSGSQALTVNNSGLFTIGG